ncbi:MAG: hypothetical protein P8P13_07935 [Flavobacteriaceae bacterium]|jgi:hypothetical protein|nr:hypothetical protein [Flavobacteriaceae bacterium]MDA7728125.1 hypothetical protein [Flavobacteriaceae bacterium]MDA7848973.1 hypothetical protein [Flavobacteriaceae bacterium]MDG1310419.1 hypothetical protein [Flavobacteriaceae bacterium]
MKGKIYLYLFVFSILVNVFQYVNSKGIIDKYEKDIKKFKAKIEVLEKSEAALLEVKKEAVELSTEETSL